MPRLRLKASALFCAGLCLASPAALAQPRTVTVAAGDTLEELAQRHRVNLQALIELNAISDPTLLQIGQVLKLPQPTATTGPSAGQSAATARQRHPGGGGPAAEPSGAARSG